MSEQKELSAVGRAAKHVETVKAQLERVTGFHPYEGKGKAIAALRHELKQAEAALAAAEKAVDAKSDAKPAPVEPIAKVSPK